MMGTGWVDAYMAIPFRERGRTRDGADCLGLAALVIAHEAGARLLDLGLGWSDGRAALEERVRAAIATGAFVRLGGPELIGSPDVRKFDLVEMRTWRAGFGSESLHLGIATGEGTVLHTEPPVGPRHLSLGDPAIRHRVVGFWRLKALVGVA